MDRKKQRDWGLVLAGILLIVCAFIFIAAPTITLVTLTVFAGLTMMVSGIFNFIAYVRFHGTGQASGWTIFYGILDIIVGLMFLIHPVALMAVIPWLIGIFVVVYGVYELVVAFKMRKIKASLWGWLLFSAIITIVTGLLFFLFPEFFIYYIAIFLLFRGMSLVLNGFSTNDDQLWTQ